MSQGYLATFTLSAIPGTKAQFQNATAHVGGDQIETSSSLNADGTVNEGFSDVDGDLGVITVDLDTVIKDTRAMYLLTLYEPNFRYPGTDFTINFNGQGYEGTGIFVIDKTLTSRIPGEMRVRMSWRTLQTGYAITTFS